MTTQQVDPGLVPYQILNAEGKLVGIGFSTYLDRYSAGLAVERAATTAI